MFETEMAQKAYAQQIQDSRPYAGDCCTASNAEQAVGRTYSMAEEATKAAAHHFDQAHKMQAGASFLYAHPEFEEFIKLIRNGSISL